MNRLPIVPILAIVATISLPSPVWALERAEIAARVKEFTVSIDGVETSGTGTIIQQEGNLYTVLTCWHVVEAEGGFEVTTADGEVHQVTEAKNLENIDLAILQFTSDIAYEVVELGDSTAITEGAASYVVGYPNAIPGIAERAYRFQNADIVSLLNSGENGYRIVHSSPMTGGSSGGGIFDRDARLVGINGETTSDSGGVTFLGLAIPLELYLAAQSDFTIPSSISPPQDFVSLGRRKLNQEDYQGAVAEFDRALASNPNNLDALSGRGEAYYQLRDFDAAIEDFKIVLRSNPNNATLFSQRGYAYDEIGQYEKAIADLNEAIRLDPQDANAYYNWGISYKNLGQDEQAIADYTEAIRLDPQYAFAYNNRGISYDDLKQYEQAISDHTEVIRLDPQYASAYSNRGLSYRNLGQDEQAISDHTEAIRLNPQFADAYYNRGISYRNLGQDEQAIADYTEAIRLDPQDPDAYYNRGISYNNLANKERAVESFQQAADLYQQQGNSELYQKTLGRIRSLQSQ
ncbi:MAG: tetratricopeptide repeat-containing serine protease family protein [Cyanobacteria bacterium J06631_2]